MPAQAANIAVPAASLSRQSAHAVEGVTVKAETEYGEGGGEERLFSYHCDLAPTLDVERPQDGQIEAACMVMLRDGEQEKLLQMRALLKHDLASVPEWLPDVHGDVRLLRFLRKCKGDSAGAVDWYRGMLAWRRREGVDRIRHKLVSGSLGPREFPCHERLQALMPVTVWSERPRMHADAVQVIYNGKWKTRGLVEAIRAGELTEEQFLLYWVSTPPKAKVPHVRHARTLTYAPTHAHAHARRWWRTSGIVILDAAIA